MLFSRNHPELGRTKLVAKSQDLEPKIQAPISANFEPPTSSEKMDFSDCDTDVPIDINLVDISQNKRDIKKQLFARIMKARILHHIPDEGLDEILSAFLEASQKSNLILKKKLNQAIRSENPASSNGA